MNAASAVAVLALAAGATACTADFNALFAGGSDGGARDVTLADGGAPRPDGSADSAKGDGGGTTTDAAPDAPGVDAHCPSGTQGCLHVSAGPGCCSAWESCDPTNGCCIDKGGPPAGKGPPCGIFGGDTPSPQCCSGLFCTKGGTCETACDKAGAGCSATNNKCCNQGKENFFCGTGGVCVACLAFSVACTSDGECCSGFCQHAGADGGRVCTGG